MFLGLEKKDGDMPALVDSGGSTLTYGQLREFCCGMAGIVPKRSLVFILCRNCVAAAAAYLACMESRAVPLLLGAAVDEELLGELMGRYRPNYIWMPEGFVPAGKTAICRRMGYALIPHSRETCRMHDGLSLLLPTSGSTGSPKLVRHSYGNLEASARNVAAFFGLDGLERPMLDLPIQYTYGLSVLNSHIYAGATVLLSDYGIMQKEHWAFFKANQATSITGVPYTYEMMKALRIMRMELPSLKLLSQGGGKLDEGLQREYARFARDTGRQFVITYGQTEGSARMAGLPAQDALERVGSIGKAIPGGRLYLADENGNKIFGDGRRGELVYEGPNVTMGYAVCREDLLLGDERNGILHTGDIAEQDRDGYFYIVGRKSRFLKLYGNRVSLDECETLIKSAFGIECACTGTDDKMRIYITGGLTVDIVQFLARMTHINQKAFQMKRIEKLPRNEAGKILYGELI